MAKPARLRPISAARDFLQSEASGGVVLMVAAAAALAIANSPWAEDYFHALHVYVGPLSLLHWINDGLMAVFFLLVGLEIKREMLDGGLSTWPRRILPGFAAVGGMVVPAAIYLILNRDHPETAHAWATPAATDIAFALGVLALLGKRVPVSLKIFLTALAILDDLGAVLIIAIFHTADLSLAWLGAAGAITALLAVLNRRGVRALWPYLSLGLVLWFCVLQSGVHATLAGVVLALSIPLMKSPAKPDDQHSPLHRLEHALAGFVAFVIVPIFGFANAGVSLAGFNLEAMSTPVTLGVAAGLFIGKQIGVFLASWLTIKANLADCPEGASLMQLYGVSLLCGIGFTMSLFIGLLAFPTDETMQSQVKLGVLAGSGLSGVLGALVLAFAKGDPTVGRART